MHDRAHPFALALCLLSLASVKPALAEDTFKVAEVHGNAWAVDTTFGSRRAASQKLSVGDTLPLSSKVTTDQNSTVKLVRTGDIAIEVKPDTEFFLGPQAKDSKDSVARLRRGALLSVIRNPEKRPDHFVVRTRAAAMGVRGTMFYVRSAPRDPNVFFCPCMGSVSVHREGEKDFVLTTQHHEAPKLLPVGKGEVKPALEIAKKNPGHSDAELEALKKLLQ